MQEFLTKLYSIYYDSCFSDDDNNIVMLAHPMTYNKWYDHNEQHLKKAIRKYKLEKIKKAV
jgi:hypothetical protein